ncbi:MAG: T9SS type A sorting domain-containing protein [Ignavibacteriales bacterium]|nr:T9SS type A sorting domain-containing protein [Ignavibacteriales bacterium]
MKKIIIIIFMILNFCNNAFAQVTERKGNLLRIDFTKPEIDLCDTLWSWFDKREANTWYSDYARRILNRDGVGYIFGYESEFNDYINYANHESYYFYNSSTQTKKTYFGLGFPTDIIWEPYTSIYDKLYLVNEGMWFLFGVSGNCFIDYADSVHYFSWYSNNKPFFTDIIGKVNNNYLLAVKADSAFPPSYDYYIADLSNSPNVEFLTKVKLDYEYDYYHLPVRIQQINDSLFLMTNESSSSIFLAELKDTSLTPLKELKYNFASDWFVENNDIYFSSGKHLIKEEFDLVSQSFTNQEILYSDIKGSFSFDYQYLVMLTTDSLIVFDYKQKELKNCYDLNNIKHLDAFILNASFVYLQQIKTITDLEDQNKLPEQFSLSQNYPNPFNPSTTIEYTIPNVETGYIPSLQHVTLKIYDILGREVATLVNEEQLPGKYVVRFDVTQISNMRYDLPSGIYFYTLRVDDSSLRSELQTRKMVLTK